MMFYKETDFKETPIGKIPKDWEITKFGNACVKIKAGGTPLTSKKEYYNGDIPFVKVEDLTNAQKYLGSTLTTITKTGLENSSAWLVPQESLLFAMYGSIGAMAINEIPVATNQAILGIIPERGKTDLEFLYYLLSSLKPSFEKQAKQTTQANLTAEIVREIKIPLPTLPEQQKIAEVLSTVDLAIQKTSEIIAKTERLKKGLMQELLTKGIGHKEFKDTEIGRIPKEWGINKIKDVGEVVSGVGFPLEYQGKKSENYIFVKVSDTNLVGNEKYIIATENTIDDEVARKLGARICPPKTVIFPKIGMVIYLRKVRILAKAGAFDNNIMGIIPNEDIVNAEFLYYYFLEKIDLAKLCGRTTAPSIRKTEVERLRIPLPSFTEQRKIAEILSSFDKKLELERNEKAKLERIKQGLMDLLLTGKVRVKL